MKRDKNRWEKSRVGKGGAILCLAVGMLMLVNGPGSAQGAAKYPTSPVEIICPFAAGAATDYLSRMMADELSKKWRVPVNVVNKVGGNTVIGVNAMMTAKPDGYTLFADSTPSSGSQIGLGGLPYDPMSRTFIARAFYVPQTLICSPDVPWRSLKDLLEAGKKDPASVVWGAAAGGRGGCDIYMLQIFDAGGIDVPKMRRVDFTGSATAINALGGGHIKFHAASPGAVLPVVTAGKARALAISSEKRSHLLPDCPTTRELGFPTADYNFWVGFTGPAGIPEEVIQTVSKTIEEILKDPGMQDRLWQRFSGVPAFLGPEAFKKFVQDEGNSIQRLLKLMTGEK